MIIVALAAEALTSSASTRATSKAKGTELGYERGPRGPSRSSWSSLPEETLEEL